MVINNLIAPPVGATRDRTEKGPWTVIGAEALTVSEGMYSPDFTATALSDSVHLLMLNIHSEEACNIIALQKRYKHYYKTSSLQTEAF